MRMLDQIVIFTRFNFTKIILFIGISSIAFAESNTSLLKARDLYSRITGVKLPLSSTVIIQMANLIEAKDTINAGRVAAQSLDFYNVNLYQFFAPKSVRKESKDTPLNDFIAMGIANTAVDRPYSDLLTKNFTVQFKPLDVNGVEAATFSAPPTTIARRELLFENRGNSGTRTVGRLINPNTMGPSGQEVEGNLRIARDANNATIAQRGTIPAAGLLTSEKFLAEHAIMGTNRRLVVFAFKDFLCRDIKEWRDGNDRISDHQVTKDIPRSPGGNPLAYHNECRTCHQVMDPLRKAFSGFNYVENNTQAFVEYSQAGAGKLLEQNDDNRKATNQPPRNPFGAYLSDNGGPEVWENFAIYGSNDTYFGWGANSYSGTGVTSFGEMITRATAFKTCAVTQVWDQICTTSLVGSEGDKIKRRLGDAFESGNFNLRNLYIQVALEPQCNGGLYEASGGAGNGGGSGSGSGGSSTNNVITFTIPAGTGSTAWNTASNPLKISMGGQTQKTLRLVNQDATPKALHVDSTLSNGGKFCAHQVGSISTGQSFDCVITSAAIGTKTCSGTTVNTYNHLVNPSATFCIEIVQ